MVGYVTAGIIVAHPAVGECIVVRRPRDVRIVVRLVLEVVEVRKAVEEVTRGVELYRGRDAGVTLAADGTHNGRVGCVSVEAMDSIDGVGRIVDAVAYCDFPHGLSASSRP